jgi:hypothetical protein
MAHEVHKTKEIHKVGVRKTLPVRRESYWARGAEGLYVGYRKINGMRGSWIARERDQDTGKQIYHALGAETDTFDFDAAVAAATKWSKPREKGVSDEPISVKEVCKAYVRTGNVRRGRRRRRAPKNDLSVRSMTRRSVPFRGRVYVPPRSRLGRTAKSKRLVRDDGMPWAHSDWDELVRNAASKAKLPVGTCLYTLRHSFVTQCITDGMTTLDVARLVGTSLTMVENRYGQFVKDAARERSAKVMMI